MVAEGKNCGQIEKKHFASPCERQISPAPQSSPEERLLILASLHSDAFTLRDILADHGLKGEVCDSLPDFLRGLEEGLGAGVLTLDVLSSAALSELLTVLERLPPWSAPPLVILTQACSCVDEALAWSLQVLEQVPTVIFLERPVRSLILVSTLKAALENRRRQYQVRDLLAELESNQVQLQYQAYHDELTGLPNRALLNDRIAHAMAHARRSGHQVAVLFMDLDRFKIINDSLGHETGDGLLQAVAERLRSVLREQDTIARLGGDEFVVLLEELPEAELAARVGRKLMKAIRRPFQVHGHELIINTSIGISLFPRDGEEASTLLRRADTALYQAKEQGRNHMQFYAVAMTMRAQEKLSLEQALHQALEAGNLELHYQPRVDLKTRRITGLETLLRWYHPDLGPIPPAKLLDLAEESGLIVPLSDWVFRTACTQAYAWQKQGLPPVPVAVNLSAGEFIQAGLLNRIQRILDQTGLQANHLELELTENILMGDTDNAIRVLGELKALGVQTAIDDFGIGYSNLSSLKRLSVNWLKIDRSFVRDIVTDPDDATLIRGIIALAHHLDLKVIAEGVETEEQWGFLETNACDEAQGYYFSRPVPAKKVMALLAKHASVASASSEGGPPSH